MFFGSFKHYYARQIAKFDNFLNGALTTLTYVFKFHNEILPSLFNTMFQTNSFFHAYATRARNNLRVPFCYTTIRSHSIRLTGAHEWNAINDDLKSSSTLSRFKSLYKRSVFQNMLAMTE